MNFTSRTAFISALGLCLSLSLISTSCYKHEDEAAPVFTDTVLDNAEVYHNDAVTLYNFRYSEGRLTEVRSHHTANGSPVTATVWRLQRDNNGTVRSLKSYNNLTEDTSVYEFSYGLSSQLTGLVTKRKTKDHSAVYPVDSIDFSSQGYTTTGWSWGNSPFLLKTEYYMAMSGNLDGKVIHSGYGSNPPYLPVAFNSSVHYTYDTKRSPLKMEHCELYFGGFRDGLFGGFHNNVITEIHTNTSGSKNYTNHTYTYNEYGQPITSTIVRHTGDTVRVYYKYK